MEKYSVKEARHLVSVHQLEGRQLTKEDIAKFPDEAFEHSVVSLEALNVDPSVYERLPSKLTDSIGFNEQAILENPYVYNYISKKRDGVMPINYECAYAASRVSKDLDALKNVDAKLFSHEPFYEMLEEAIHKNLEKTLDSDLEYLRVSPTKIQAKIDQVEETLYDPERGLIPQYEAWVKENQKIGSKKFVRKPDEKDNG